MSRGSSCNKKIAVVPIKGKTAADLRPALEEALNNMGSTPQMIYSDAEAGFAAISTLDWLAKTKRIAQNENMSDPLCFRLAPVALTRHTPKESGPWIPDCFPGFAS